MTPKHLRWGGRKGESEVTAKSSIACKIPVVWYACIFHVGYIGHILMDVTSWDVLISVLWQVSYLKS
jgi:hypothetical protein